MTNEQIRERLAVCKLSENELNKQLSHLDWLIKDANKKKKKLAKQVSKNMKYRNSLIKKLKNKC